MPAADPFTGNVKSIICLLVFKMHSVFSYIQCSALDYRFLQFSMWDRLVRWTLLLSKHAQVCSVEGTMLSGLPHVTLSSTAEG